MINLKLIAKISEFFQIFLFIIEHYFVIYIFFIILESKIFIQDI